MSFDRVLFVGLGGAGQRHLRILRGLLPKARMLAVRRTGATPLLNADFTVAQGTLEDRYGVECFASLEAALAEQPQLTVISTPSSLHLEPMRAALAAGSGILVEKPWSHSLDGFAEFRDAVLASGLPFAVSFQRRHHPLLARAREALRAGAVGKPMAASFTVHSHVPSWHPYEDWRQLYAVRPELGGGVLLTEIHELDLAHWYFGLPDAVFCTGGNRGPEPLAVEDTVQLSLLHAGFSVQVELSFMAGKPARRFHVAGSAGTLAWDADGNRLAVGAEVVADPAYPNDAMFEAQARRLVGGWTAADSREALAAAGGSLAIVAAARRSMASGKAEPVDRSVLEGVS